MIIFALSPILAAVFMPYHQQAANRNKTDAGAESKGKFNKADDRPYNFRSSCCSGTSP